MPTWLLIIIINGVVAVLFAFAAYIWRNLEGRVKGMEIDAKAYTDKLLEHPLLTADAHTAICSKTIGQVKEFVQGQSDHIIKQMADGETRTGLLIENAILKASQNGNGKKNGIRRKK
jgi:hypothetical protein